MFTIVDIDELGRRVRRLRLERRMTLKDVESACGLSATHLSEIERGRTSPTIGALVRIARALDKDASYFIEQEERAEVAHQTRDGAVDTPVAEGVRASALTRGIPGSGLFAYRVALEPKPGAELRLAAQELPGDAIYFVERGEVETTVGETVVRLAAGDSMQATLERAHRLRAVGTQPAELVLACSGPLGGRPATADAARGNAS